MNRHTYNVTLLLVLVLGLTSTVSAGLDEVESTFERGRPELAADKCTEWGNSFAPTNETGLVPNDDGTYSYVPPTSENASTNPKPSIDHAADVLLFCYDLEKAFSGHVESQFNIALQLFKGNIVPRDYSRAVYWFRKAAEQGDVTAQFNLAVLYQRGDGIPQDFVQATKWYRLAANSGDTDAQLNLGYMYYKGLGLAPNYIRAHMWSNLAASQGNTKAADNRELIARQMTYSQIAKAQRLAREWWTQKEQHQKKPQTSPLVRDVQKLLTTRGYDTGPIDGIMGSKTRASVRAYQRDKGLPVTGEVNQSLLKRLSREELKPRLAATGTGVVVSRSGHILTNQHVVDGCREIRLTPSTAPSPIVASNDRDDLALIDGPPPKKGSATFRATGGMTPGERVVVAGYPLRGVLASGINISTGIVSALGGPNNNADQLQITAPVQPGNSGGPLLDQYGQVSGIVVGKLDAVKLAQATGDIPQNINFAIKASVARKFLDNQGVEYQTGSDRQSIDNAAIADQASKYTVLVQCWK